MTGKRRQYLINREAVRAYTLECARRQRHHTFTRVSGHTLDWAEAQLAAAIQRLVQQHPDKGKTIKP